jgi:hypothetical protein
LISGSGSNSTRYDDKEFEPSSPGLPAGLTREAAADTAWVIASRDTHDLLVRQAGYTYDQLEEWVRTTVTAAHLE